MGNDCHDGLGASAVPLMDDAAFERLPCNMRRYGDENNLWRGVAHVGR